MRYDLENRLKEIRAAQEKQQGEIAAYAGLSCRTYMRYEKGAVPNHATAMHIADALGIENLRDIWTYKNPH